MVRYGVEWIGVVWYGVVWCGVVWVGGYAGRVGRGPVVTSSAVRGALMSVATVALTIARGASGARAVKAGTDSM